jgi:hypothetical protein
MLNLTDRSRTFLKIVGALSRDENGREVLTGLSFTESEFFLMYQECSAPRQLWTEARLFAKLMNRHLQARQLKLDTRELLQAEMPWKQEALLR